MYINEDISFKTQVLTYMCFPVVPYLKSQLQCERNGAIHVSTSSFTTLLHKHKKHVVRPQPIKCLNVDTYKYALKPCFQMGAIKENWKFGQ